VTAHGLNLDGTASRRTMMFAVAGGALVALTAASPGEALAAAATPGAGTPVDGPVSAVILFGIPKDPAAFEAHYLNVHVPLAQKIPAAGYEMGLALSTLDGSPLPYYRIATLHLTGMAQFKTALASPQGQAALGDLANFATGGVTVFVVSGPTAVPMQTPG